jgi:hypothetical protein
MGDDCEMESRSVPECLGQIAERHDEYCSTCCPNSALCVVMFMQVYLRQYPRGKRAS